MSDAALFVAVMVSAVTSMSVAHTTTQLSTRSQRETSLRGIEHDWIPAGMTIVPCQVPFVRSPEINTMSVLPERSFQPNDRGRYPELHPSLKYVAVPAITSVTSSVATNVTVTDAAPLVTSTEVGDTDTDTRDGGVPSHPSQKSMVSVGPVLMGQVSPVWSQPVWLPAVSERVSHWMVTVWSGVPVAMGMLACQVPSCVVPSMSEAVTHPSHWP